MSLKWRTLKTRSKIMLAVAMALVVVLVTQYVLGRYYFGQVCQTEGRWYVPPSEQIVDNTRPYYNSEAHDVLRKGVSGGLSWLPFRDSKGCGGLYSWCIIGLTTFTTSHNGSYDFVEIFVHRPTAEFLSSETGWHRYWLAPLHDTACAAFYSSEKAQANWREWFSEIGSHSRSRLAQLGIASDTKCIASEKIEKPKSRSLHRERDGTEKRIFGLYIDREDWINLDNRRIVIHQQYTEYRGPWLYEAARWLGKRLTGKRLEVEGCPAPPGGYNEGYMERDPPKEPVYAPIYDEL